MTIKELAGKILHYHTKQAIEQNTWCIVMGIVEDSLPTLTDAIKFIVENDLDRPLSPEAFFPETLSLSSLTEAIIYNAMLDEILGHPGKSFVQPNPTKTRCQT